MKYLCKQTTQHRDQSQIYLCEKGEVYDFTDKPSKERFVKIDDPDYQLDFKTASEDELLETEWAKVEAARAIKAEYGVKLNIEAGILKSDLVKQILDVRYRAIDKTILT